MSFRHHIGREHDIENGKSDGSRASDDVVVFKLGFIAKLSIIENTRLSIGFMLLKNVPYCRKKYLHDAVYPSSFSQIITSAGTATCSRKKAACKF